MSLKSKFFAIIFSFLLILGGGGYYAYNNGYLDNYLQTYLGDYLKKSVTYKTPEESDVYTRFMMEGYDSILKNQWAKIEDTDMAGLFQLSLQKAENTTNLPILETKDRTGTAKMINSAFSVATSTEARKQLAVNVLTVALYNLQPVGRNGLLSEKQVTELRQTVSNINPEKDLYKDLGVEKGADKQTVEIAYKNKSTELAKQTSPEAKEELKKVEYAHSVLAKDDSKKLYDTAQIEPTVFGRVLGGTLYIYFSKISPTTLQEFGRVIYSASTTPKLDSLIIDFRGNIGGALDFLQYFLGLFIGDKQFAFDLFHQGDYQDQRTIIAKLPELERYKEIAIFTDNMTQSTAEVTTASFKRFNLAKVIGVATRGWGSVENTYPLETIIDPNEKFALLLVNSLTLRDDNQPIEGKGIDPSIDIKNPSWKTDVLNSFRSQSLIKNVLKQIQEAPLK